MNDVGKTAPVPYRWIILAVAMLAGFIGSYAQFHRVFKRIMDCSPGNYRKRQDA